MATPFHLSVLTPERSVLEEDVTYIQAPGMLGYLGVLAHHAPLISALVPGKLTVRDTSGREVEYALAGGFLEVSDNQAVILADALERREEIDLDRARSAERRARERIAARHRGDVDAARAQAALERSLNRLKVATR
jgi:F-type H+-transporting ATPase subunit epsilon